MSSLRRRISFLREKKEKAVREKRNGEEEESDRASLDPTDSLIAEELECPVCLEEMRPPKRIFSCSNAHLFCERCNDASRLRSCPKCREDFGRSASSSPSSSSGRAPARNRLAERWACKIFS